MAHHATSYYAMRVHGESCILLLFRLGPLVCLNLCHAQASESYARYQDTIQQRIDSWGSSIRSFEEVRTSPEAIDLSHPPGVELKEVFDAMPAAHRRAKLYKNWETYEASLPVIHIRLNGKAVRQKLHMLQLDLSDEKDVLKMAEKLLHKGEEYSRPDYASGEEPSSLIKVFKKQKSPLILPAFLAGRKFFPIVYEKKKLLKGGFTHYLHLACHDNGERTFRFEKPFLLSEAFVDPPWRMVDYGTSFILECLKTLLHEPDNLARYVVKDKAVPKGAYNSVKETRDAAAALIRDRLGADSRVLLHIDGLSKVADRPHFTTSACLLLAMIPNVTVVATDAVTDGYIWVDTSL
uniref:Uncharacterized protein n=1 Tax=Chrysotila carterae TaxID=13221 RepID=A0A7S4FB78_CHRCT|mmetsp:Transcript_31860/g.61307  ORF Transcript_31860/g.61307 Transcript_31860/m.61307 type:complete len:350 (+) Transcript_31860:85-1134(+)|eukprot:6173899-Pleurochrysis_carterae.AAC.2